jgi:hypothetical protein
MARKVQKQTKPSSGTQRDAVFTQLMITAIRIYGDPCFSSRKVLKTR